MAEKEGTLRMALNAAKRAGRKFAAKRAIRMIRENVKKNFRVSVEKISIAKEVNETVWKNGSYNLPTRVELDILKDKNAAWVFLKDGKEKKAFEAKQKKEKEKKTEKTKEKKEDKTKEEKKEEAEEKAEQEKQLEEKRLKETMAGKAEFK